MRSWYVPYIGKGRTASARRQRQRESEENCDELETIDTCLVCGSGAGIVVIPGIASRWGRRAGEGEVGINFIAFNCPNLETDPYTGCDFPASASFEILADGVPLAGSPSPQGRPVCCPVSSSARLPDATLTITELSVRSARQRASARLRSAGGERSRYRHRRMRRRIDVPHDRVHQSAICDCRWPSRR